MIVKSVLALAVVACLAEADDSGRLFPPHLVASQDPLFPLFCSGKPAGLYLGGLLPNESITASSFQEGYAPIMVRGGMDGYWRPENSSLATKDRFIQIDLGEKRQVAGILASTEMGIAQTKSVMIRHSQDCENFEFLKDNNGVRLRLELGLRHVNHTWQVFFPQVLVARCIAVTPLADDPDIGPSLELDIVVCGFSQDGVKEEDLSADVTPISVKTQKEEKFRARDYEGYSHYKFGSSWWHYSGAQSILTLKVSDMGENRIIFGVYGNGTRIGDSKISYSVDCETYWPISDAVGNAMVFQLGSATRQLFPNPVRAMCIRILPNDRSYSGKSEIELLVLPWYTGLRATCGRAVDVGYPALVVPPPETPGTITTVDFKPMKTEAPFAASINMCSEIDGCHHRCSATLIASEWLVTSAACVTDEQSDPLNVENIRVQFGNTGPEEYVGVAAIRAHTVFKSNPDLSELEHDVALVKLSTPVSLTPHVLPACLADKTTFRMDGLRCTVVGQDSSGRGIQMSVMPSISSEDCSDFLSSTIPGVNIQEEQMCLGFLNSTRQACKVDSGAGVFCYDLSPTRWTLHGVVSWTMGDCSEVAVTSWLPNYSEWIQSIISAHHGPVIPTV